MPQPVDLQTEIARVTAAERIQQAADRASLAAQQRVTSDIEETRVSAETQVQETEETGNEQVDENGRRKNPFIGRRKKTSGGQGEVSSSKVKAGDLRVIPEGIEAHKLDITI